jgi:hypothetical protein
MEHAMKAAGGLFPLRWQASSSASALHAVDCLLRSRSLVDPGLTADLQPARDEWQRALAPLGPRQPLLWQHLIPLSAGMGNNRELAELALRKAYGPNEAAARAARVADCVAATEAAFRGRYPRADEELVLRGRPLRELWEARGPGLLRRLVELTEQDVLPAAAEVLLVQPVRGGGGAAHLPYNSVRIEALLVNPASDVPELLRLAWLLAQLNLDLPKFGEGVSAWRLPVVAGLAIVPAVLEAAEFVELARLDPPSLQTALAAWQVECTGSDAASTDTAEVLLDWWTTYRETRPAFHVALRALDQMLTRGD